MYIFKVVQFLPDNWYSGKNYLSDKKINIKFKSFFPFNGRFSAEKTAH